MPSNRKIVYKFLSLPVVTAIHFAKELGLLVEGDFEKSQLEMSKDFILRAYRQDKLYKLWKLMMS